MSFQDSNIGDTSEFVMSASGQIIVARIEEYAKPTKIVVKNLDTGELSQILGPDGSAPNANCVKAAISADGSTVAFVSGATNLGFLNPQKSVNIYTWDRESKKITCLTEKCPADILARHPYSLSVANGGKRILFETLPLNSMPSRLFVIDGDKGVQTLAGALRLGDVQEEDYRGGMSADGSVIYAAVQDKVYSKGQSSPNPVIIVASLDKGISNRIYLRSRAVVGGLCVSGDGSTVAFNDCQYQSGQIQLTVYTAERNSPTPIAWRKHIEKNQSHYPWALAINGNGTAIACQSAQGNAKGEDMIYVGTWPGNQWQVASIDRYGNRNEYFCGIDARSLRGFAFTNNTSILTFVGRFDDPNHREHVTGKLYRRDLELGKTTRIQ